MIVNMSCSTKGLLFQDISGDLNFLNFTLTSSKDILKDKILTPGFKSSIGHIQSDLYSRHPYFFASPEIHTTESGILSQEEEKAITASAQMYFNNIEKFIASLWFVKDNSCNIGQFHSYPVGLNRAFVYNNSSSCSNAKGEKDEDITFNEKEIYDAGQIFIKANLLCYHNNLKIQTKADPLPPMILPRAYVPYDYSQVTRIERALHFLQLARGTGLLPLKLSFYICIFETLFSGQTKSEITHQLSERVGFYEGYSKHSRHGIYTLLKKAYSIRSTYFHGQAFKKKDIDTLPELSSNIDFLTRSVFRKVIMDDSEAFLQNSDKLEMSFMELIFSDKKAHGSTWETKDHISFKCVDEENTFTMRKKN